MSGWSKRESTGGNFVSIGDDEKQVAKVSGLLFAVKRNKRYPDKEDYELVQPNGEIITLSGNASLSSKMSETDIGCFVKCQFVGWGRTKSGQAFKDIDVEIYEGEPDEKMKKYPKYAEAQANRARVHGGGNKDSMPTSPATTDEPEPDAFDDFSLPF